MKGFDRLIALTLAVIAAVFVIINVIPYSGKEGAGLHNIETNRAVRVISDTGEIPDTGAYETILGIFPQTDGEDFYASRNEYVIREINGRLYRIEYKEIQKDNSRLYINITAAVMSLILLAVMIYLRQTVIKPFREISELPYELARCDLTVPLKERKNRYFGKFIWGLDMLREELEHSRRNELELQKEKKTMLMSLSHDIKTPLSAIKLSAKALERGLYTDPQKQRETAAGINANADDIERLVNEIMKSSTEDLMRFDVKDGEFYLSEVADRITAHYREKLSETEFTVSGYSDCILCGDADRLTEVIQNIIENAIKYGDGHYIHITFSDEEDFRLVTVSNSGCTLPENEVPHIFDSFWRGSNSGSKSGSGLGLYICRSLMSAMSGDIFASVQGDEMRVTVVCRKK